MKKRYFIFFLCAVLSLPGPLHAKLSFKDLKLPPELFPVSSEYHQIEGVIEDPSMPGSLIFYVSDTQRKARVDGLVALKKWIHETMVIGELDKEQNATEGVAEGAVESLKGTGRGLTNMVVHPVASAKGLGSAFGKLGSKIGGAFQKKDEGEKGDTFLSSTKRQIAKKLKVDVYSRNPELQEKLSSLAKQQIGGRGVVMVATFLIPFGFIASAVMTASNVNNAADELVNDKDRADLYTLNKEALLAQGFPLPEIMALLNHPYYTPREITYIRFYLEKLRLLNGAGALLTEANRLTDPVPAQKFLHEMQIAADAMETIHDAEAVRIVPEGLILQRQDSVALITGYDYVDVSPLGNQSVERVTEVKNQQGKKTAAIWNGGIVTSKFGGGLILKGIELRRMCLFDLSDVGQDPIAP